MASSHGTDRLTTRHDLCNNPRLVFLAPPPPTTGSCENFQPPDRLRDSTMFSVHSKPNGQNQTEDSQIRTSSERWPQNTAYDEGAIDDIKAARQIREICNSVSGSAERVAVLFYGPNNKSKKREIDRYKRARKLAEKKVEQISDKLLRDTALNQILNFCMKANDIESAEKLFHQLQTTMIKENVISEHPIFRD
jgi:pentatricopeptide repeat protein